MAALLKLEELIQFQLFELQACGLKLKAAAMPPCSDFWQRGIKTSQRDNADPWAATIRRCAVTI
jgi:hypothetical protein